MLSRWFIVVSFSTGAAGRVPASSMGAICSRRAAAKVMREGAHRGCRGWWREAFIRSPSGQGCGLKCFLLMCA